MISGRTFQLRCSRLRHTTVDQGGLRGRLGEQMALRSDGKGLAREALCDDRSSLAVLSVVVVVPVAVLMICLNRCQERFTQQCTEGTARPEKTPCDMMHALGSRLDGDLNRWPQSGGWTTISEGASG